MTMNVKTANAKAVTGKCVYVLVCEWRDRHGPEGLDTPRVFSNPYDARMAMAEDVVCYIDSHHGFKSDGELDTDAIYCVNNAMDGSPNRKAVTREAKRAYQYTVNVDDDGTYANWQIHLVKVDG